MHRKSLLKPGMILVSSWLAALMIFPLPAQQFSRKLMVPDQDLPVLPVLKQDFMINSLGGDYGAEQSLPAIAADSSGNYAVAWVDQRDGMYDIYIQFFNNRDEALGDNIQVNEQSPCIDYYIAVAANNGGDFVVVWKTSSSDLMAQRFSNSGMKAGGNIQVTASPATINNEFALAVAGNGSFVVCWDGYYMQEGVFASVFDADGIEVNQVMLNDSVSSTGLDVTEHGVAADNLGNFVVVWQNYGDNSFEFLQQIDMQGNKVGNNLRIDSKVQDMGNDHPSISATTDGYFLIAWNYYNYSTDSSGTAARIYQSRERILSEPIIISAENSDLYSGTLAGNRKDTFWIINEDLDYERFSCQKISKTGELLGEPLYCTLDTPDSMSLRITRDLNIAGLVTDRFYLCFIRNRRGDADIFTRNYDPGLLPLNNPRKVNLDPGSSWQIEPAVCFNQQGGSIVLWQDQRNGRQDLYAQVYDANFNTLGDNMQINDQSGDQWYLGGKQVRALSDGKFVVAFSGTATMDDRMICLQIVDPGGYKINANKIVNRIINPDYFYNIELNINRQDQILVCWYNQTSATVQKYDQNLLDLSTGKILYSNTSPADYLNVKVSINEQLNILVAWLAGGNTHSLYGLVYDQDGNTISKTYKIEDFNNSVWLSTLDACLNDQGDNIVTWLRDSRIYVWRTYTTDQTYTMQNSFQSSYDIKQLTSSILHSENHKILINYNYESENTLCYLNDNKHIASFYRLGYNESSMFFDSRLRVGAIFNDNLFFVSESNRHGESGIDIWGNVQNMAGIDLDPEPFHPPSGDDTLYPNYPNPFNGVTRIDYELLAYHKVRLAVYDVLGREIKVLVDKNQEKGYYQVEFDAAGLASGIYFVRLEAFRTQTRKMVVIK